MVFAMGSTNHASEGKGCSWPGREPWSLEQKPLEKYRIQATEPVILPFYKLLDFLTQHFSSSTAPFLVGKARTQVLEPSWAQPDAAQPRFPFLKHHCSTTTPKYFRSVGWVKCSEIKKKKKLYNLFNLPTNL